MSNRISGSEYISFEIEHKRHKAVIEGFFFLATLFSFSQKYASKTARDVVRETAVHLRPFAVIR